MALQVSQIDDVFRPRDAGGQVIHLAAERMGPLNGSALIGHTVVSADKPDAIQIALGTQLHHIIREQPGHVIDGDIGGADPVFLRIWLWAWNSASQPARAVASPPREAMLLSTMV